MNTKAGNATVAELVNDKLASIGEKIGVTKFERIDAPYVLLIFMALTVLVYWWD